MYLPTTQPRQQHGIQQDAWPGLRLHQLPLALLDNPLHELVYQLQLDAQLAPQTRAPEHKVGGEQRIDHSLEQQLAAAMKGRHNGRVLHQLRFQPMSH